MDKKILQTGLYITDPKEVEQFVGRVTKFNAGHIGSAVKLDIIPMEEGSPVKKEPHFAVRLLFPSREIQRAFWI